MKSRHRHTGSQSGGRPRFFFLLFLVVVTVSMIFFVVKNITAFQFELQQDWLVPAESSYSQIHQTAELHRFVSKAKEQMSLNDRKGLPRPLGKEIHYKVTKFQLSAGTSTSFQFSLQLLNDGANNSTEKVRTELSYSNYTSEDRIICRPRHPYIMIFQHFSQVAFPCWSILRRFPNSQRMMEIAESGRFRQRWITDMLEVFQSSGISINSKATNMDDAKNEWVATPNKTAESGWQHVISDEDPLEVEIVGPTYFIDQQDVIALQQHLLGEDYISNKAGSKLPLRVLLVTREGESRNWMYAQEVATEIERIWGDWIEVKLLPKITGSLKEQAVQFHRADIVISPHGGQLTNLAFIRPCTTVLELFPIQYYLSFFQNYVLSAGGISFEGYPLGRSPLHDTSLTPINRTIRTSARGKPMLASPESILHALPMLFLSCLSCQEDKLI